MAVKIKESKENSFYSWIRRQKYISDIHNVGFPNEEYIPKQGDEHKVHWLINKLFSNILLKNTQNRNEYSGYFKKLVVNIKILH